MYFVARFNIQENAFLWKTPSYVVTCLDKYVKPFCHPNTLCWKGPSNKIPLLRNSFFHLAMTFSIFFFDLVAIGIFSYGPHRTTEQILSCQCFLTDHYTFYLKTLVIYSCFRMYNIRLLGVQHLTGCVVKHWESNNTKYTIHVSSTEKVITFDKIINT